MYKIWPRHNAVGRGTLALRSAGLIKRRRFLSIVFFCLRGSRIYSACFWGAIFFGLTGVVEMKGTIISSTQLNISVEIMSAHGSSRQTETNRRDPFTRIKKSLSTPKVSSKRHLDSTLVPRIEVPLWRLLGVIHGQNGRQAVIQISPHERVVVQTGSKLAPSGWTIKTINEGEVLLEHLSKGVSSPPKTFILSFPTIRKSP